MTMKLIRTTGLIAALAAAPLAAQAPTSQPATGTQGTATGGTTGTSSGTTSGTSTGTTTGVGATGSSGGYADPNATPVTATNPAMGTQPNESGGEVEDTDEGGSKAGWLGLLGLIGLVGLRRGHAHVMSRNDSTTRV